jgi:hypothetical protein
LLVLFVFLTPLKNYNMKKESKKELVTTHDTDKVDNTAETTTDVRNDKADCEASAIIMGDQNWPERDDTPEDNIDYLGFDNCLELKTKEWSFFHDDRRPGDVYLLLATIADSSGVATKRLLVGTWNDYTNNWQCHEGFAGSVIQILAWLWLPEINEQAFYNLEEMWDRLREKQLAYGMLDRTDNPEDHNDGPAIEL